MDNDIQQEDIQINYFAERESDGFKGQKKVVFLSHALTSMATETSRRLNLLPRRQEKWKDWMRCTQTAAWAPHDITRRSSRWMLLFCKPWQALKNIATIFFNFY